MADVDLKAGLRTLRESLHQMKALLAWEQLKQSEARPDQSPALQMSDPTETDLKNEYSFFLSTSIQMHNILDEGSFATQKAEPQDIKKQLAKIEQQAHSLNLHERFCKS